MNLSTNKKNFKTILIVLSITLSSPVLAFGFGSLGGAAGDALQTGAAQGNVPGNQQGNPGQNNKPGQNSNLAPNNNLAPNSNLGPNSNLAPNSNLKQSNSPPTQNQPPNNANPDAAMPTVPVMRFP